jgi:hypothetical protein
MRTDITRLLNRPGGTKKADNTKVNLSSHTEIAGKFLSA